MRLEMRGAHMAVNAAAAFAAAVACGVSPATTVEAFAGAGSAAWRMNVHRLDHGVVVINDAYNANPVSMLAALEALAAVPAERHVAIVGVMAELGGDAEEAHREIASTARSLGIELVAVGTDWYGVAPHTDPVAVLGALPRNVAVLVKASRAAGLEHVAQRLLAVLGHTL
jgi:UDP-N-acetylmuramoyl-tripeptide--D-alanyl-D-alanine ligase